MRKRIKGIKIYSSGFIQTTEQTTRKAYIKVFGELMPLTIEEVRKVSSSVTIIWK